MKRCSRCKTYKDLAMYGKNKSTVDGATRYCKPCISGYRKDAKNKKSIRKAQREYYINNIKNNEERLEEYRVSNRARYNRRYREDVLFKLKVNLRNRLNMAIKNNQKSGSAVSDLGCSIEELKSYLESKFYSNPENDQQMTWDNWGKGENKWNIDHILEFRHVDLEDKAMLRKINHFTNLQPLWQIDHVIKTRSNQGD